MDTSTNLDINTKTPSIQPQTRLRQSVQTDSSSLNKTRELSKEEPNLNELTKELNQEIESLNTNIKFQFNEEVGELYISVVEKDSGVVIRQIPSEEAMKLREHLKNVVGMIFDNNI